MSRKLTQEEFIKISTKAHEALYDYSLAKYDGRLVPVEIICTKHNKSFWQPAGLHMDGQTSCHECIVEKKMASRVVRMNSEVPIGHKRCTSCKEIKPKDAFNKQLIGARGLSSYCKSCISLKSSAKRQEPAVRARIKIASREYTKRNRDRANVKSAKRRAMRIRATPPWAETDTEKSLIAAAYTLAITRSEETGTPWQVDHLVPLNSDICCGLHCAANLEVVPAFDNLSKGNRWWPDMWTDADYPQTQLAA
ncbi:MAG: hypothetical protein KGI54_16985 [Pseudomonadota bacterium]|nr:hypothetical protein [Pseudomonadota bacterium]